MRAVKAYWITRKTSFIFKFTIIRQIAYIKVLLILTTLCKLQFINGKLLNIILLINNVREPSYWFPILI